MTRRSPGIRLAHRATERAYGEKLMELLPQFALLAKKWQDEDIIWPHSDLDLRVVLRETPPNWLSFNEALAEVHRSQVRRDPLMRRVLEHPPGFVFLTRELDQQLVRPAEISTWSISHGPTRQLQRWRDLHSALPWTADDENFYRSLMNTRVAGRYNLAYDSTENVTRDRAKYGYHCVMWHYFAPCQVAAHALATRVRATGKASTMKVAGVPLARDVLAAANGRYRGAAATKAMLGLAGHELTPPEHLSPVLEAPEYLHADAQPSVRRESLTATPRPNALDRRRRLVCALANLRCRPARLLYYLEPAPGAVTGYLLGRESKDLGAALHDLREGIDLLPHQVRRDAVAVLEQFPSMTEAGHAEACLSELYRRPDSYERLMGAVLDEIGDDKRD